MPRKLVSDWGINDAWYAVERKLPDGSRWRCKYHQKWASMVNRVYSVSSMRKYPTYRDVEICEEWRHFTNFRKWCESEELRTGVSVDELQIDKDILSSDALIYSPETCRLVDQTGNKL